MNGKNRDIAWKAANLVAAGTACRDRIRPPGAVMMRGTGVNNVMGHPEKV